MEIILIIIIFVIMADKQDEIKGFFLPAQGASVRVDPKGNGYFGSSRDGHTHQGLDLTVVPKQPIYAPFSGVITRQAYPYKNDTKYTGLHLKQEGGDYLFKIFYMQPVAGIIGKAVKKGEIIGYAQDISLKYGPPMKPHVHVEFWRAGKPENPLNFFTNLIK